MDRTFDRAGISRLRFERLPCYPSGRARRRWRISRVPYIADRFRVEPSGTTILSLPFETQPDQFVFLQAPQ
jgi:hypothetical protein